MLLAKITNEEKFNLVSDVDFSEASKSICTRSLSFDGTVSVVLKNGKQIESWGEHGANDWKDEFGFVVIEEKNIYDANII